MNGRRPDWPSAHTWIAEKMMITSAVPKEVPGIQSSATTCESRAPLQNVEDAASACMPGKALCLLSRDPVAALRSLLQRPAVVDSSWKLV